ncbi:MAG: hypothetical protein AB1384_08480 [Actinomycetota bacterium]
MKIPARTAAAITAWGLLFLCLLAVILAIVFSCGETCRAEPAGGDAETSRGGYGYIPPCEPEQPPGPAKDMGSLPEPCTWTQAAVGILLPGLIGLGIALILNQAGPRGSAAPAFPVAPTVPASATGGAERADASYPGLSLPPSPAPPPAGVPPAQGPEGPAGIRGWDEAKAGKAAAYMDDAVKRSLEGAEAGERGNTGDGTGRSGLVKMGGVEAVAIGSGTRALLDRIASRISADEEPPQRDRQAAPVFAQSLEMLEVPETHVDRELSETRQALSQTERSMAKLDAAAGRAGVEEALRGRLESGVQDHGAGGIGGEVLGQADEAAKEYLEYLALRRDLRLKEAVFEYRRKSTEKEDERA